MALLKPSSIRFKFVTEADKETLFGLMERYYEFDHLVYSKTKADQAVTLLLKDPNLGQVWLIETDSKSIGYVVLVYSFGLEFGGRVAFIDELFIEEAYRSKGIGTAAVRWCMQKSRDQGISTLRLEVTPTNPDALGLYTHLGFVDYDRYLLTYEAP